MVYNSLANNSEQLKKKKRKKVLPNFGVLYPETTTKLVKVSSFNDLKQILMCYPAYYNLVEHVIDPRDASKFNLKDIKTLDDYMMEEAVKRYSIAFEQQFHFACFYAYIKIKEQEIKNICLLAEMVPLGKDDKSKIKKGYIVPFNY